MRGGGRVASTWEEAAGWAQQEAERAAENGTFGVGGVLLGPAKELLACSRNQVMHQGEVCDPTAHGERQLVDWYFAQNSLPPACECTVVTSLDPCMMCAGALLYAGFRVVTLALDPEAGVNCAGDFSFSTLPVSLRPLAQQRFAYLGVQGSRAAYGCEETVSGHFERTSYALFRESLERVKSSIHSRPSGPFQELPWTDQEAALLDAAGRVVAVANGSGQTRTAVMELARRYPFKELTLVQRRGPDLSSLSLMEMGAYGSNLEGPLPAAPQARWQYLEAGCQPSELNAQLERMPAHYREVVGMRIERRS